MTIELARAAGPSGRAVGIDIDERRSAVEDLFTGTLRAEPPAPALDQLQEVYSGTVRAHGGDPTIGPRLPTLFAAAGLDEIRAGVADAAGDPERIFYQARIHQVWGSRGRSSAS